MWSAALTRPFSSTVSSSTPERRGSSCTAAGRQDRAVDLDLAEAEKRELTTEPEPPTCGRTARASSAGTPVAHDDAEARRLPADARLRRRPGAGAAGLVLDGVFGGLAFHEASVVKSNCDKNISPAMQPE